MCTLLAGALFSWSSGVAFGQNNAGNALHFGGANAYVQGSSNGLLNAFPLTITAWIRTSRNLNEVDGIVTKYADASANGYALFTVNGNVHGWYFRNNAGDHVFPTSQGIDGGFIADGNWHHIAFVVDGLGGRIYVDGAQTGTTPWAGTAGATTSGQSLQVGQYVTVGNITNSFIGDLDEITLWNRSLSANEVNYLKHRHLGGKEDGLLTNWRCDETAGTTLTDSSPQHLDGTLVNGMTRIASGAVVGLNPVATNCLKFDGAGGYVSVANASDLDALPLTVMAWVKTTRTNAAADGIVSMYQDASFSGYSMHLLNGHVRAWYFANFGDSIFDGSEGLDGGPIADGDWHHVALVVDNNGGRLLVDGNQMQSLQWNGNPAATTTAVPLQLGRYWTFANTFLGQIDEVSIWNRSFNTSEIQAQKNLPLAGTESGLVAYWRLDEGNGVTASDSASHNHSGTLQSTATWTGSTAFLGDGTTHLFESLDFVNVTQPFMINDSAQEAGFGLDVGAALTRIYDYGPPSLPEQVAVRLDNAMQVAPAGPSVPLQSGPVNLTNIIGSYLASGPIGSSAANGRALVNSSYQLQPANGVQIDSVDNLHQFVVTLSHDENGGAFSLDATNSSDATRLLQFDGNLFFGPVLTMFTNVDGTPLVTKIVAGDHLDCSIAVSQDAGYLPFAPGHFYGDGNAIAVSLFTNGDSVASSTTTVAVRGPAIDADSIQNISFSRGPVTLTATGALAAVTLNLPTGFAVGLSTDNHLAVPVIPYSTVFLDQSLHPVTNSMTIAGPWYGIAETLPYWFVAPSLTWLVNNGQIVLNPSGGLFVRQPDDDLLTSAQAALVDTNAANRVGNDGYFRNAQPSGSLTVSADSNGTALVSVQLSLSPPELRPHFPYSGNQPGRQIATAAGGILNVSNSLVDTTDSYLAIGSPVPVVYHQDCSEAATCPATQIAPVGLSFTPTVSGQLNFTRDGGLLSYGAVSAPTTLAWGYVSGLNYAQRAGPVQGGVYCMAGVFLRGDQCGLPSQQFPAALLFSGFGDGSDPTYLERPGDTAYQSGLANYPGLNFRATGTGQSHLAKQDTGPYPLDPRSKLYLRYGGVNGIHQCLAGSFPTNLKLYGYGFTFSSYGLSFLDGENWESRTDGAVAFPTQPAGFTQEFDRMKLTCRGDLASAQLPLTSSTKHLNYWNADFTPQSLEFRGTSDDPCDVSNRFLVLGVETTLPFIGEGLHAALGFKPNGNLVTPADSVQGIDSRFPVPAHLSVQGPGNTTFTFSPGAEGYFNNWETPNRPISGFYNLLGKLRVPFFIDFKTHLHVTPLGATSSQVDIMGGWPAANSTATDLGWSLKQGNFFNTTKFDPHSDGWPIALVPLAGYRNSTNTQFRPRAQRDWIEVATFDYPLQWNPVLHSFASFEDSKVVLPIIDVNTRLKELAHGKIDIDFAQDVNLQLPRLKALDFVNDALDGNIGPLLTVSNAIRQELATDLNVAGINELSQTLREDAQTFFDPVVKPALDPAVSFLYSKLAGMNQLAQTNEPLFLQQVYQLVDAPAGVISNAISTINGSAGDTKTVIGKLDKTMTDVQDTLGVFDRALAKNTNGERHVVTVIVQKVVADQSATVLGTFTTLGDEVVNPIVNELDPTLTEIQTDFETVSNQLAEVHQQLLGASGDFNQALTAALNDPNSIEGFIQSAATQVTNFLATVLSASGDYLTADSAAVQTQIRQQLEMAFLGSAIPANYQTSFRQFLYDKDFVLDQLMSTLFDQINRAIRDGLSSKITGAQDGQFQNMKGTGLLSQSLLAAQIKGAPVFNNDSLRNIHLDAAIQLNVSDPLKFNAYMDIKELDSQSVPVSCVPAGTPSAEVTLGSKKVPLAWGGVNDSPGSSPLSLDLDAQWILQNGAVIGLGGQIDLSGGPAFQGCSLKDLGATLVLGPNENYFVGKAEASVVVGGIPADFQASIFAGHACSVDPLSLVDKEFAQVLLNKPETFSGVYIQYGGGLSLTDILLGKSSCLLDVQANISTTEYYQDGVKLGIIGGRQKIGVDASVLCALKGHADWAQFFQLDSAGKLTVGGDVNVCGTIGPCPLCIQGCKGVTIKGVLTRGGIDYFLDY